MAALAEPCPANGPLPSRRARNQSSPWGAIHASSITAHLEFIPRRGKGRGEWVFTTGAVDPIESRAGTAAEKRLAAWGLAFFFVLILCQAFPTLILSPNELA